MVIETNTKETQIEKIKIGSRLRLYIPIQTIQMGNWDYIAVTKSRYFKSCIKAFPVDLPDGSVDDTNGVALVFTGRYVYAVRSKRKGRANGFGKGYMSKSDLFNEVLFKKEVNELDPTSIKNAVILYEKNGHVISYDEKLVKDIGLSSDLVKKNILSRLNLMSIHQRLSSKK